MRYILSVAVVIILIFVGYLGLKNSSLFRIKVEQPISTSVEWPVYKNARYGLELSYPDGFIVEEDGSSFDIHFGSTLINRGNIFIKVFDTTQSKIKNVDDISYTNKGTSNINILSSKDNINRNGVAFRQINSVQNSSANNATILFIHSDNAYELNWSCWPSKPCFDDVSLEKLVQSIKFNN
jgi:hypothetical protein